MPKIKKFDKNKYDNEYKKRNYKRVVMLFKPEEFAYLQHFMDFDNEKNLSMNEYTKRCIIKCINDGYKG